MRSTKNLSNPWSTAALVEELDDTTLKCGHALLDQSRSEEFSHWLDDQLEDLESQFRAFATSRTIRHSLGR